MYGIIMTAVTGVVGIHYQTKTSKISMDYQSLSPIKKKGNARYLIGGTLFGLGWAL
jgi:uncharacterized membrane protein YedE/YeeE